MSDFQKFRGAFNGFNREDVVNYLARMNHEHEARCNQLNNEIKALQAELDALRTCRKNAEDLSARLEEAQAKNSALEQEMQTLRLQADRAQTESELEAYRRAERAERAAGARVSQMYAQAAAILADATAHTDETATQVGELTQQICRQLELLQTTLNDGAGAIRETAAAMYALKPVPEAE